MAKQGRAIATQQYGCLTAACDQSIVEAKSRSCIARECHKKLIGHDKSLPKPEVKSQKAPTDGLLSLASYTLSPLLFTILRFIVEGEGFSNFC